MASNSSHLQLQHRKVGLDVVRLVQALMGGVAVGGRRGRDDDETRRESRGVSHGARSDKNCCAMGRGV